MSDWSPVNLLRIDQLPEAVRRALDPDERRAAPKSGYRHAARADGQMIAEQSSRLSLVAWPLLTVIFAAVAIGTGIALFGSSGIDWTTWSTDAAAHAFLFVLSLALACGSAIATARSIRLRRGRRLGVVFTDEHVAFVSDALTGGASGARIRCLDRRAISGWELRGLTLRLEVQRKPQGHPTTVEYELPETLSADALAAQCEAELGHPSPVREYA